MFGSSTRGRDEEFTQFVRSASGSLSWTAYLLTGEKDAAAELLQEALVKTYLAWPRVRHGEAAAYARRTLVNLSIDRCGGVRRFRPTTTTGRSGAMPRPGWTTGTSWCECWPGCRSSSGR